MHRKRCVRRITLLTSIASGTTTVATRVLCITAWASVEVERLRGRRGKGAGWWVGEDGSDEGDIFVKAWASVDVERLRGRRGKGVGWWVGEEGWVGEDAWVGDDAWVEGDILVILGKVGIFRRYGEFCLCGGGRKVAL